MKCTILDLQDSSNKKSELFFMQYLKFRRVRKVCCIAFLSFFLSATMYGQMHTQIVGDSVLVHGNNGNGELILENATRHVNGFLFNKGNGRTEFKRGVVKLNDSLYLIGADTIKINNLSASQFIFNQTIKQPAANFHIDGSGTLSKLNINGAQDVSILNLKRSNNGSHKTPLITIKDSLDSTILEIRGYYKVVPENTASLYIGNGSGANTSIGGTYGGINNTALGHKAMGSATTGSWNTAVGRHALSSLLTGGFNTALGEKAMQWFVSGEDNTAVGQAAMYNLTSGNYNIAIGSNTLFSNTNGTENIAIGVAAGYTNTGSKNLFIGRSAGRLNTGSNNIFIGYTAGYFSGAVSNKLYIHNSSTNSPLIYGDFDNLQATINGRLSVSSLNTSGTAPTTSGSTKMVVTDDQGQLSFTNLPSSTISKAFQTLIDDATISWNISNGNNAKVILNGSRTLSISNVSSGDHGTLIITQDGTGNRTITLPSNSKVINNGSGAITLSTAANAIDIISWIYDGSTFYWKYGNTYN
jgi:hypothetical protein